MTTKEYTKDVLGEKSGFQIWWRMLRPHTLTASFVPVFVGTVIASIETTVHYGLFFAMLLASMLIQAATNMFNEYYDFVKGLDTEKSVGIGGTIVRDGISPQTVRWLAFMFYGLAILLGFYICIETNFWIALIGLISMLFGYLYTGGPYPIAYSPFGELFSGFFMGTVIIGISYFIQTSYLSVEAVLLSLPVAVLIGAILLSNNIRDLEGDKKNGRKTLAILIGRDNAIRLLAYFFISAYVFTIILITLGMMPVWGVITLLSIKKPINAVKVFKNNHTPLEMMPAMKFTAQTNTMFGILFGISFLLNHLYSIQSLA
ncbi:1,4-dihydroxy-2-naphthoate polyprenyltransferase [Tenuibacillus multivorans]|uniref:1,4-dihydroxy-2-naphthoate octaprenyltransferase n=1 Tax=Tenuibacillus multivorans TaxID=237069 RepID=A0A1H0FR96_9BACI|nr:1,4-dihydroxy-2-naphthoate polyprenyltransferase [Tenuibacillus multivorans]GEL77917.1 1,4-dihydroxy-2-naphthoate octaprenyltransferase [Tenuibacillus multivorans]SDN97155.1 1,4-dihydroxy-2-naphthoate octaprenyltransferase [Tenuibacillus multivorans]